MANIGKPVRRIRIEPERSPKKPPSPSKAPKRPQPEPRKVR